MSYLVVLKKEKVVIFLALLAVLLIVPFFPNRIISGTIVNASLFIAARYLGLRGIILSCVPSAIAVVSGLLPMYFAPLIPYIMISNAVLMGIVRYIKNYWLGLSLAAILKGSIIFIALRLFGGELAFLPFCYTILFGGAIAYIFLRK
ncbi:MAG: hypothetical protein JW769_03020 [Parachlamydiales bacterium]|nr:hypothetical protein [Parachlamydiales bacterium]